MRNHTQYAWAHLFGVFFLFTLSSITPSHVFQLFWLPLLLMRLGTAVVMFLFGWVAQCFLFLTLTFSPFTFSFQNKQVRMSKRHFIVGQQTRALLGKNFLRKWRMKRETLSVWFRVYVISYLKEDRVLSCVQTLYLFSLLFHRYSVSN